MVKASQQASPRPKQSRKIKIKPAATGRLGKASRAPRMAPEARREAILKAALSVFAAHGFEAARLEDVAARAGVAKGTLYLYFRDKEALFEALVRSAVSPLLEHMDRIATAPDIQ